MIDYLPKLKEELEIILPVYYETFLNKNCEVPCISIMESNNYDSIVGETIVYSRVSFNVKVWSNKISELQKYSLEVDKVMKRLGFKRMSSNELFDPNSTMGQKVLRYEALGIEK